MRNNAKVLFRQEMDEIKAKAGIKFCTMATLLELIQGKHPWVQCYVLIDAGCIVFGSEECLMGWYMCQD